jgi:hypothetical protein
MTKLTSKGPGSSLRLAMSTRKAVSLQEICAQDRKADGGKEKTPFTWHTIKGHSKLLLAPARNAAAVCRKETYGLRL